MHLGSPAAPSVAFILKPIGATGPTAGWQLQATATNWQVFDGLQHFTPASLQKAVVAPVWQVMCVPVHPLQPAPPFAQPPPPGASTQVTEAPEQAGPAVGIDYTPALEPGRVPPPLLVLPASRPRTTSRRSKAARTTLQLFRPNSTPTFGSSCCTPLSKNRTWKQHANRSASVDQPIKRFRLGKSSFGVALV